MSELLFSPEDMEMASLHFDAMCGHGALAAALGCRVLLVMPLFDRGGWVNIPMMQDAVQKAGHTCAKVHSIPVSGCAVIMVQFLGRWMEAGVPIAARCAHRHWVAIREGQFWDVNFQVWMSPEEWEKRAPSMYGPKTTGHEFAGIYRITKGAE